MKKKLLFLVFPLVFMSLVLHGQDNVWDFGNDVTNFPVGPAFSDTRVIDGLTLVGGGSDFATIEPNSGTWTDGYSSTNRLKSEGNSSVDGSGLPTRRYMEFPVDGSVTVKLWFRFSGSGVPRAVVVADASGTEVMRFDSVGDSDRRYIEADYTGGATTLLVFSEGNAVNYYKLETATIAPPTEDKVWDFGNDTTNFPVGPAFSDTRVIDGLTLVGGGSDFATVEPNSGTWDDGYTSTNRLKSEGNSSVDGSGLPTRRYMEFPITSPVSVKLWYRFSGSGTPRAVVISDNTGAEVARFDSLGDSDRRYLEANYTGSGTSLLVFSENNAVNYYKLEVSSTLLSTNDETLGINTNIKSVNDRVFISNVHSSTQVDIYTITGSRLKTIKTNNDIDFILSPGIYIARIKTNKGEKSIKLITY